MITSILQADVPIATVEWEGQEPPILYAHATGFHKWVWRKLAQLVGRRAVAMDFRGHGDSGKPPDDYRWSHFAGEVLAVLDRLRLPVPIDGVGHTLGGGALLLAEQRRPGTFRRLVLYEPVVFPALPHDRPNPLVGGARRRRMVFTSLDDARESYGAKPPFRSWDPEILDDYVRHGLFERPDGRWELKCAGEIEAQVYENSRGSGAWDRMGEVRCPTLVVSGTDASNYLSSLADVQAAALGDGHLIRIDGGGHFAPMEQPAELARLITEFLRD